MGQRHGERKRVPIVREFIRGQPCVYCGAPAEVQDHVIPKRLAPFFDAGWNLVPSCHSCNTKKNDKLAVEQVRAPGESPVEDAAVWAVAYNILDGNAAAKSRLVVRAKEDLLQFGPFWGSEGLAAFEYFTSRHFCELWTECQERCSTYGDLACWAQGKETHYFAPEQLRKLVKRPFP